MPQHLAIQVSMQQQECFNPLSEQRPAAWLQAARHAAGSGRQLQSQGPGAAAAAAAAAAAGVRHRRSCGAGGREVLALPPRSTSPQPAFQAVPSVIHNRSACSLHIMHTSLTCNQLLPF